MKFSVAPLSSRAFVSALVPPVYSETSAYIARFLALYTGSLVHARVRAVALRRFENPSPPLRGSLPSQRHPVLPPRIAVHMLLTAVPRVFR
jgi:hypothetical protein